MAEKQYKIYINSNEISINNLLNKIKSLKFYSSNASNVYKQLAELLIGANSNDITNKLQLIEDLNDYKNFIENPNNNDISIEDFNHFIEEFINTDEHNAGISQLSQETSYWDESYNYSNIISFIDDIVESLNKGDNYNKYSRDLITDPVKEELKKIINSLNDNNQNSENELSNSSGEILNYLENNPNFANKYQQEYESAIGSKKYKDPTELEKIKNKIINIISGYIKDSSSSQSSTSKKEFNIYIGNKLTLGQKIDKLVDELNKLYSSLENLPEVEAQSIYLNAMFNTVMSITTTTDKSELLGNNIASDEDYLNAEPDVQGLVNGYKPNQNTLDNEYIYTQSDKTSLDSLARQAQSNYENQVDMRNQITSKLTELDSLLNEYQSKHDNESYEHKPINETAPKSPSNEIIEEANNIYGKHNLTNVEFSWDQEGDITIEDGHSVSIKITSIDVEGTLTLNTSMSSSSQWKASVYNQGTIHTVTITNNTSHPEKSTISAGEIKATFTPSDQNRYNIMENVIVNKGTITLAKKEVPTYTVNVVVTNGTANPSEQTVEAGGTVEFTINPNPGYTLDGVTPNKGNLNNNGILTLNNVQSDTTIYVTCQEDQSTPAETYYFGIFNEAKEHQVFDPERATNTDYEHENWMEGQIVNCHINKSALNGNNNYKVSEIEDIVGSELNEKEWNSENANTTKVDSILIFENWWKHIKFLKKDGSTISDWGVEFYRIIIDEIPYILIVSRDGEISLTNGHSIIFKYQENEIINRNVDIIPNTYYYEQNPGDDNNDYNNGIGGDDNNDYNNGIGGDDNNDYNNGIGGDDKYYWYLGYDQDLYDNPESSKSKMLTLTSNNAPTQYTQASGNKYQIPGTTPNYLIMVVPTSWSVPVIGNPAGGQIALGKEKSDISITGISGVTFDVYSTASEATINEVYIN